MSKKVTSSVKSFIWQLQKFPMNQLFKYKIDRIVNSRWDSAKVKQNTLIIKDGLKTYTISIGKDTVEYNICYKDGDIYDNYIVEEIGKIYKCDKNIITKYLESTITNRYDYQEITIKTTISCFNEDFTEIFKSITTNHENYNEETGKKALIQYEDRGYPLYDYNNLTTTKIRRTHGGNLIRIDEVTYYVDSQQKYNKKVYSIRKSSESNIPNTDTEYTPIPEELYMNYMHFRTAETELFRHYVKNKTN